MQKIFGGSWVFLLHEAEIPRDIVEIAKPLGIVVHDHIIVGRDGHASLKGLRLI